MTMIPVFKPGPLSASHLNLLRAAVLNGRAIVGGPGVSVTETPAGVVISVLSAMDDWKRGVIVNGPTGLDEVASAIRYDVKVVGVDAVETGLEAKIARPAGGFARLIPARAGDPCYVLRVPSGDGTFESFLWAMTETLSPGRCTE